MKRRFLSDLVSGIRGRVTLAAPPPTRVYPHNLSNYIFGGLPLSDGNSSFQKNHSQKFRKDFPGAGLFKFFRSSVLARAVSAGIFSFLACSPSCVYAQIQNINGVDLITEGQTYQKGLTKLNSSSLVANGQKLEFTLENGANLSFDMDLKFEYSQPFPDLENSPYVLA